MSTIAIGAAGLGFVAGLRSQVPLLLLTVATNEERFGQHGGTPLNLFSSHSALLGTTLSTAAEFVFDKLPIAPDRIRPLPLAGRLFFGGLAGAAVFRDAGRPLAAGAALGAAGATAGSFASYKARVALSRATPLPNLLTGLLEDVVAFGLGILALRAITSGTSSTD